MAQRDDDLNQAHVRFAEREEHIPQPSRQIFRQDSEGRPRRGTYDSIGSASDERTRYRQGSGDLPSPRAQHGVEGPIYVRAGRRHVAPETVLADEYGDLTRDESTSDGDGYPARGESLILPQDDQNARFAESPTPLEDNTVRYPSPGAGHRGRRQSRDAIVSPSDWAPHPYGSRPQTRPRSRSPYPIRSVAPTPHQDYYAGAASEPQSISHNHYSQFTANQEFVPRRHRQASNASDDLEPYEKFQFDHISQSITESSKDGESDNEQPESEDRALPRDERGKSRTSYPTTVKFSQYTGNAELGGSHSATLTAVHGSSDQNQSLFKWLHVRQEVMNFEEFWMEISRLFGLSNLEKRAIARLRADVKGSVKSRYDPKGTKVGYMEPRSIEIPLKSFNKKMENDATIGSARWMCIPYFSLEQYSNSLTASNSSLFPAQTLLQAQYSRNTAQRDMEQAVCRLGHAKRGECFHIAQLWCVIIDNGLLVTCGTMTQSDLQGDAFKVNDEPSRDLTAGNEGWILVSYGGSMSWSLAADECQTWFAFVSKFQAFWPKVLEFWHKDRIITPVRWPKILRLVSRSRSTVKIIMKLGSFPDPPPRAVLKPKLEDKINSQDGHAGIDSDDFLHVLMLPQANSKGSYPMSNVSVLKAQLDSANEFLMSNTSYSNRRLYQACPSSTRSECYEYLASLSETVDEGTDEIRRAYEEKISIFNAAETLYQFFLPVDFNDLTSGKFWGAIQKLLHMRVLDPNFITAFIDQTVSEIRVLLREFTSHLIAFQNIMSHASEEERAALEMPREFMHAWLYTVMGMVYGAQDDRLWSRRTSRMRELTEQGMGKLMHWLPNKSLLERMSMMPLEVLSLMTLNLLQDQVGKSDDICETYSQYLNSLENSIMSSPSDRSYQHRIDLVQQEMVAVRRTLWKQRTIISSIRRSLTVVGAQRIGLRSREELAVKRDKWYQPPQNYVGPRYGAMEPTPAKPANDYMEFDEEFAQEIAVASKLSPTDANGLRGLLLMECSRLIEQREYEFRRYAEYANDLERALSFKMNFTKDRQENAIFAFTLVTIIFLPISAVSSIFGMNTVDVRDMEATQWLYWAVAIPVTVFVILVGLWWMGELGNIVQWLMRKPRQTSQGSYGGPVVVSQPMDEGYFPSTAMAPGMGIGYAHNPFAPRAQGVGMEYGASSMAPGPGLNRVQTYGTQRPYMASSVYGGGARSAMY